jgi:Transposase DDE domain
MFTLQRTRSPAGRQHRPAAVRTRRVAGREAWYPETPVLAQAAHRDGCRDWQILATELTTHDVDDGSQVKPLLDQVEGSLASLTGDGAYDRADVYDAVAKLHPDADVTVPPRSTAVPSDMAESTPTQRDRHLQSIAEHGCMGWQKRSGYTRRALVEAAISRLKRVIGDALRSRTDQRRLTEVAIAVQALNRMLELGRPKSVRIA